MECLFNGPGRFTAGKDRFIKAGRVSGTVCTRETVPERGKYRRHRDSIAGPPARSESLYRLSYSSPLTKTGQDMIERAVNAAEVLWKCLL
jgi:hypothetical protein